VNTQSQGAILISEGTIADQPFLNVLGVHVQTAKIYTQIKRVILDRIDILSSSRKLVNVVVSCKRCKCN